MVIWSLVGGCLLHCLLLKQSQMTLKNQRISLSYQRSTGHEQWISLPTWMECRLFSFH